MEILVLGGTGVISTSVVRLCAEKGYHVTCVNRGRRKNENKDINVDVFYSNVSDEDSMSAFLKGKTFDVVIDFLCYTKGSVQGHLRYLTGHIKQYVLISTDSVYKVKQEGAIYSEDDERGNPIWQYSTGKIACEDYVKEFCPANGIEYTIVRPAVTFGDTRIPYGLMPKEGFHYYLVDRMKHGKYIPTWNNGSNVSTLIRSEDFAKLFVPILGNKEAYSEVFNVCGDEYVSNADVLQVISDYVGTPVKTVDIGVQEITRVFRDKVGEFAVDRAYDHKVKNDKIKAFSGTTISIGVKNGIEKSIAYYEQNHYCSGVDYFFEGQIDKVINDSQKVKEKQKFVNYRGALIKHKIEYLKGYYCNSIVMRTVFALNTLSLKVWTKLRYIISGHC